MDPRKFGVMMDLDTRYLERRNVRGKPGFAWNNRHAKPHGLHAEWLGFDPVKAAQRAHELNRQYDDARKGKVGLYKDGTLGWWLDKIEKMPEHSQRPYNTRNEVETNFKRLRASPLATYQLETIAGRHIKILTAKLTEASGLSIAHATAKWLRFALNLAVQEKKLGSNPMSGMRVKKPSARQVILWEEEVNRAIEYSKQIGRPSLGLAIRIAFDIGQRESDILKFPKSKFQNNEFIIKQGKTGATVRIPALPESVRAISETPATDCIQLVVSEETGRPYKKDNFSKLVNDVFRALDLRDEETGKSKVFQDLRRSSVVRLALAGCSIPMIAAITGHSYAYCEKILEVYLPRTTEMARAAIEKLLAWRKERA
jgi:hypothetical protein